MLRWFEIDWDTFYKKCARCPDLEIAIIENDKVKVACKKLRCEKICKKGKAF